jgi:hypothetical protein
MAKAVFLTVGDDPVEFDKKPYRTERLDLMELLRPRDAGMFWIEDGFCTCLKNTITESAIDHAYQPPDPWLGAMPAAEGGRHRGLVEHRSLSV